VHGNVFNTDAQAAAFTGEDSASMKNLGWLFALVLLSPGTARADPCNWHEKIRSAPIRQTLKKGLVLYGRDTYPSVVIDSVVIRSANDTANEIVVNGDHDIDFRSTYLRTGESEFKNIGPSLGCELYGKANVVRFSDRQRFPDPPAPTIALASYCQGSLDDTRLLTPFEATLYQALNKPYCVGFDDQVFDPFGMGRESARIPRPIPPWESVKSLYAVVMVPGSMTKQKYTLEIRTIVTTVSDRQCVACYPEVDCSKLATEKISSRNEPLTVSGDRNWTVIALTEIDSLNFAEEVYALRFQMRLKAGEKVVDYRAWDISWPRCM
jgi:hypothetical protein